MSKLPALEQPEAPELPDAALSQPPDAADDPPQAPATPSPSIPPPPPVPALDAERIANMAEAILFQLISQRHGSYEPLSTVSAAFDYAIQFEKRRLALPDTPCK